MTIYTRQINNIVEQLPITDQQFILEVIKGIGSNSGGIKETANKMPNQKEAVRRFIEEINATEPLADDELDEILNDRINITREF